MGKNGNTGSQSSHGEANQKKPLPNPGGLVEVFYEEPKRTAPRALLYLANLDREVGSNACYQYDYDGCAMVGSRRMQLVEGEHIELEVYALTYDDGVNITITGYASALARCERCLCQYRVPVTLKLQRTYYYPAVYAELEAEISVAHADKYEMKEEYAEYGLQLPEMSIEEILCTEETEDLADTLDKAYCLDDQNWQVDLLPMIIDAFVPQVPFKLVCAEDCPGLCPECGIPLKTAEPGHVASHWSDIPPTLADWQRQLNKWAIEFAETDSEDKTQE